MSIKTYLIVNTYSVCLSTYLCVLVDLVDEGDIVTVKCDQVFRIPIQLWSVPATITTLSLHIPKETGHI